MPKALLWTYPLDQGTQDLPQPGEMEAREPLASLRQGAGRQGTVRWKTENCPQALGSRPNFTKGRGDMALSPHHCERAGTRGMELIAESSAAADPVPAILLLLTGALWASTILPQLRKPKTRQDEQLAPGHSMVQ